MPHIFNDTLDGFYYELHVTQGDNLWTVVTEQPLIGVKYASTFKTREQATAMANTAIAVIKSLIEKAVMCSLVKKEIIQ